MSSTSAEPTNEQRRQRAHRALRKAGYVQGNSSIDAITDLMTDLAHLADHYGDDGILALRRAETHYGAERYPTVGTRVYHRGIGYGWWATVNVRRGPHVSETIILGPYTSKLQAALAADEAGEQAKGGEL